MQKLTFAPEGYQGAMSLVDRYSQEDIHNLMKSIEEGAKKNDIDVINSKSEELSKAFDDLWKDADRISKLTDRISYAFMLSFSLVGAFVTQSVGAGHLGLLAGLGLRVLDRKFTLLVSDKLARVVSPNHLIAIHDFKQRYAISKL
jgi:hypothetical protein